MKNFFKEINTINAKHISMYTTPIAKFTADIKSETTYDSFYESTDYTENTD